ncbi:MAG: TetR/AcrR family transcriptional regulator [Bdellovibrionaceae bacterium]|nr:TetR/AcrR family transcriptional regulator [Pseudobdellovibrionaceae bacterium]
MLTLNQLLNRSLIYPDRTWDGKPVPKLPSFRGRPKVHDTHRVVLIAHALFLKYGYHGTTIRMITAEADIAIGSLYYTFRSKRLLYGACLEYAARLYQQEKPREDAKSLIHDALMEQLRYCVITKKVLRRLFLSPDMAPHPRRLINLLKHLPRVRTEKFWIDGLRRQTDA